VASVAVTKAAGLYTSPNELSALPEGALVQADNVIIRNTGVVEARRGFELTSSFGSSGHTAESLGFYGGYVLLHSSAGSLYHSNPQWTAYSGTYAEPTLSAYHTRMEFVESESDLFFTTSTGIYFLDAIGATPARAGGLLARDIQRLETSTSGSVWNWNNSNSSRVSYRVLWGKKDANGRYIWGVPSGRSLISNTSAAARSVKLRIPQARDVASTDIVRVYRTESSLGSTIDPGDDHYLVHESYGVPAFTVGVGTMSLPGGGADDVTVNVGGAHSVNVGDFVTVSPGEANYPAGTYEVISVTATTFTYTDNGVALMPNNTAQQTFYISKYVLDQTPDSMLGAPLYTNPSDGEGVLQANHAPPLAVHVAEWKDRVWYANTKTKHRFTLNLLGVDVAAAGDAGIRAGDTITINSAVYTAVAAATVPTARQFRVDPNSSSSAAIEVEDTAKELVRAINENPTNTTLFAYYVSGVNDVPGELVIEEITPGGSSFSVTASRVASWFPNTTTAQTSTADVGKNRIYYSKPNQPEAVPLLNYFEVGRRDKEILRIVPQADKLYVFKEDGIWAVYGTNDFSVTEVDLTVVPVMPHAIVPVNNKIYAPTTKGFVAVSEAGVQLISRPIDNDVIPVIQRHTKSTAQAFAVGYEQEGLYLAFTDVTTGASNFAWVYNTANNTWTKWSLVAHSGGVNPADGKLYLGYVNLNYLYKERKSFARTDYMDLGTSFTINSCTDVSTADIAQFDIVFAAGAPQVGDLVYQLGLAENYAIVTAVNGTTARVVQTQNSDVGTLFDPGGCTVYSAYTCTVKFAAQAGGVPYQTKHFRSVDLLFKRAEFLSASLLTATDLAESDSTSTVQFSDAYSTLSVTDTLYSSRSFPRNKRLLVAQAKQRGTYLQVGFQIRQAGTDWALNGYAVEAEPMSERTNR
jgi:hypothetical protein